MKLTINRIDGVVGIDGVFHPVDCSSLPENLRVVQWDDTAGHTEWTDRPNEDFADLGRYQAIIDQWTARQTEAEARAADPCYGMTDTERLAAAKDRKKTDIMAAFVAETKKPIDIGALKFDGGWTSLDKLDRAIQFADKLGIAERTFYETDETPHVLPIRGDGVTGESILIAIAMAYDSLDAKMRAMVKAVNGATTPEDVEYVEISWT